ncbi:hypothetical protein [Actinomadura luteofluorescens]|uniref:hypothetical protein n=1 Tax=Actinomadura luteofluorescens TaxID=46163 RepID=UPI0030CD06B8
MPIVENMAGRIVDMIREVVNGRAEDEFAAGFDEATRISLSILKKNIDGLHDKIESDSLSDDEQFLLTRLSKIVSEMEKSLHDHWNSAATDEVQS